mgnify:CR=1 FL=1
MGLITNILQGIRKNLNGHALDTRFDPISWFTGKIIKHEDDITLKLRKLGPISVLYKRPYELLKTYNEIFCAMGPDIIESRKYYEIIAEYLGKETKEGTECFKIKLTKTPITVAGKKEENVVFYYFHNHHFL